MTNEDFYDKEIAPALLELMKKCEQKGMSFVSVVEYLPQQRGRTNFLTKDAGLAMVMISHAAKCGENIDGYVIGMKRYANENNIDTNASIVMSMT